jgi:putative tryptophan/tyrosine transport system substrate-binding protein
VQRREFTTLIGGAATWPLAARAQQRNRVYRIAILEGGSAVNAAEVDLIEKIVKGLGWSPGQDLEIDYRWSAGDPELNKAYAKEIIGMKPDAIVAVTNSAMAALHRFGDSDRVCYCERPGWNALR